MDTCPYCGFDGVYNSGFSVECPNPDCRCFSKDHCIAWIQQEMRRRIEDFFAGKVSAKWPTPFEASNPTPTTVEITIPSNPEIFVIHFDITQSADCAEPERCGTYGRGESL